MNSNKPGSWGTGDGAAYPGTLFGSFWVSKKNKNSLPQRPFFGFFFRRCLFLKALKRADAVLGTQKRTDKSKQFLFGNCLRARVLRCIFFSNRMALRIRIRPLRLARFALPPRPHPVNFCTTGAIPIEGCTTTNLLKTPAALRQTGAQTKSKTKFKS